MGGRGTGRRAGEERRQRAAGNRWERGRQDAMKVGDINGRLMGLYRKI